MPLGILLASAWVTTMNVGEIASEVERSLDFLATDWADVPERQRSLRATFDYSWNLLSQREQTIFQNLSVFRGGFSRDAAGQISGASAYELRAQVDKSYLQLTSAGRYEVHELMRQYGAEKLAARPEANRAAHERHSIYFCKALGGWEQELKSSQQESVLREMDVEHENFRLAWNWAVDQNQVDQIDRGLEGLCLYYEFRVRFQEGANACRMASEMMNRMEVKDDRVLTLARVQTWSARFNRLLGNEDLALHLRQESLDLINEIADEGLKSLRERAFLNLEMGNATLHSDREAACSWFQKSLGLYRSLEDNWCEAKALTGLGEVAYRLGNYADAVQFYQKSLTHFRKLGDPRGCANCLAELGNTMFRSGMLKEGDGYLQESMDLYKKVGDRAGFARGLKEMGRYYAWYGDFDKSVDMMGEATAIYEDLGYQHDMAITISTVGYAIMLGGWYDQVINQAAKAMPLAQEMNFHRLFGVSYMFLGGARFAQQEYLQAEEDLKEGIIVFRQLGQKEDLTAMMALLGGVHLRLGRTSQARKYLRDALKNCLEIRGYVSTPITFSMVALYLVYLGELKRANEVYTAITRFPMVAKSPWFEDIAGREIKEKASELPSESVIVAEERGMSRDLYDIAEEQLEIFS
jgi:tetratricopeptide (TPR) repeat protein